MGVEDGPGPDIGLTGARFGGSPRRRRKARKRPPADSGDTDAEEVSRWNAVTDIFAVVRIDDPEGSLDSTENAEGDDGPYGQLFGNTGARFGGSSRRLSPPDELARKVVVPVQPNEPEEWYAEPTGSRSVRPYVFTRGRTRSQFELSIEGLVSAVPSASAAHLGAEHQAVMELCREARSVAEIGALLGVPLGVARVLVGDLAGAGAVTLHRTADAAGPDLALMERVLAGLRRL